MTPAFLYQMPIADVEFSVRTTNCLQASGLYPTLGHLAAATDNDLLRVPNLGRKSFKEIREVIKSVLGGPLGGDEQIVCWALDHKKLIQALIAGEATIVPRPTGQPLPAEELYP